MPLDKPSAISLRFSMTTQLLGTKRWQFSLRGLLCLTFGVALVCFASITLGSYGFHGALIALILVLGLAFLRGRARSAFALAFSALYGPFVAMAGYTSLFVGCSHCKAAAWQVLPFGPAIIPYEVAKQTLGLPHFSSTFGNIATLVIAGSLLAGLAALTTRLKRWSRFASLSFFLVVSSIAAIGVLAAIRS